MSEATDELEGRLWEAFRREADQSLAISRVHAGIAALPVDGATRIDRVAVLQVLTDELPGDRER